MTRRPPGRVRSLRVQLALTGFVAVVVPVLVLLSVVLVSNRETETTQDTPDGGTTVDVTEVVESSVPPVVPITAALLAIPAAAAAWWWSGRATDAIEQVTATSERIQAGSLDERIRMVGAPEEVQALADSFDRMLDRLESASALQGRLIEDVSHELRTALAALATNAEVALAPPDPDPASMRSAMERIDRLATRLQMTLDGLLADTRARGHRLRQVDNDLVAVVRRVIDAQRDLEPAVEVLLHAPARLPLGIDGPSVERAVRNLVANAVRHGGDDGPVEVVVLTRGHEAVLSVTDHGPGIPPNQHERVFERYHRGTRDEDNDGDRLADGQIDDGHGIGLALVRAVADAYAGITITSPLGQHGGTRFEMAFDLTGEPTPETGTIEG